MSTTKNAVKYSLDDVGCYVDGARGIYAIDKIVRFVMDHGANIPLVAVHEFETDAEDDCDSFMNDNYGVDGAYWGRNENVDWGLWTIEND